MENGRGQPFTIRGCHNTVTACTLPAWLPGHIVDSMNKFFGGQLRQELVELIGRSELLQNRAQSAGSHGLSPDSAEQANFIFQAAILQKGAQWFLGDWDCDASLVK
jgi:hypothetical protein